MPRVHTAWAALALLGLSGCGGNLATVAGEATYDGRPIEDGSIVLTPVDGKGPVSGGPVVNGKYIVSGVLPGPKVAKVEGYRRVNFASSSEEMMRRAAEAKKRGDDSGLVDPADMIPPSAEGNNQTVAIKPGRPFVFGRLGEKFLLGLPGNPVSAFVSFLLLARPALLRRQGASGISLPAFPGVLAEPLANPGTRRHYMRVIVDVDGRVRSAGIQASHGMSSLAAANGLVDVPPASRLLMLAVSPSTGRPSSVRAPSMWSKERFSMHRTTKVSIGARS